LQAEFLRSGEAVLSTEESLPAAQSVEMDIGGTGIPQYGLANGLRGRIMCELRVGVKEFATVTAYLAT
jgi:hypothetical protein